ncbi:MAG TPA: hypothetical protein VFN67_20690 [Polyangiales bacterium]|nr:hypothetical protein [Polyangiales bacterium]
MRRHVKVLVAQLTLTLAVLLSAAAPAAAYTARTQAGCTPITFASTPQVVLHTAEMSGFDFVTTLQLLDAIVDVHNQFNAVGGTTAAVASTITLSTNPFVFKQWFNDPTPTIHVGFTSSASADPGATFWNVNSANCRILEAHIAIKNPDIFSWRFTEPSYAGEPWYMAGLTSPDGRYFRIAYVHELLHAFGLAHSADGFAMLNYGDRTWANRPEPERIKPLPDDIEGLRELYPGGSTRTEVGLFNSWYDPTQLSSGAYPAASQAFLCAPSGGTGWAGRFASLCATAPVTQLCPGDTLYTRVAVANYGTDDVDVAMTMWLSQDDVLNTSADLAAPETRSFALGAQSSSQQGRVYSLPASAAFATEYTVIVKAVATEQTAAGSSSDWVPLRGKIRTLPRSSCP